jgi:RND family efflux transporter MFP subunit
MNRRHPIWRIANFFALAAAACDHAPPGPAPGAAKVPVRLAAVANGDVHVTTEYLATLKSRRSLVLQPQIEGLVTQIFVTSGQQVEAGAPILQIDPARQAALLLSEQQARSAKLASQSYWKQQTERLSALYQGGAVSLQELQQARTNYESAKAELGSLGAQVRQQQVQLNYYRVTAPARGTVGDIPVRVGDRVTASTQLTTLSNNELLEAYVSVPVERSGEVRPDAPIELYDSSGALQASTKVTFVAPVVSEDLQAVLVKAVVDNPKGALRSGQVLRARLQTSTHKSPAVPVTSVFRLGGQHFVYMAREEKGGLYAQQRAVSVGTITGNDYEVTSGLQPGDKVVVSGVQKLRDGAPLQPEE